MTAASTAAARHERSRPDARTTQTISPDATPQVTVQAVLCWSEYYNGKWQPTKTSDVEPTRLTLGPVRSALAGAFDRSTRCDVCRLDERREADCVCVIESASAMMARRHFFFYNTHSLPVPRGDDQPASGLRAITLVRQRDLRHLERCLHRSRTTDGLERSRSTPARVLETHDLTIDRPAHRAASSRCRTPGTRRSSIEDSRHVFFVTTDGAAGAGSRDYRRLRHRGQSPRTGRRRFRRWFCRPLRRPLGRSSGATAVRSARIRRRRPGADAAVRHRGRLHPPGHRHHRQREVRRHADRAVGRDLPNGNAGS